MLLFSSSLGFSLSTKSAYNPVLRFPVKLASKLSNVGIIAKRKRLLDQSSSLNLFFFLFLDLSTTFDLIVTDLNMPVMDGKAAASEIRAFENAQGLPKVPIVAMTAHAVAGYKTKSVAAGMDDYITKPLRRKELLETVEKWLAV